MDYSRLSDKNSADFFKVFEIDNKLKMKYHMRTLRLHLEKTRMFILASPESED